MNTEVSPLTIQYAPIKKILEEDGVEEVSINRPNEIFVEKKGEIERREINLSYGQLNGLAKLVASYSNQKIDAETPILGTTLPDGERIQILIPPACEDGEITYSIRKPSTMDLSLSDYQNFGSFDSIVEIKDDYSPVDKELMALKEAKNYQEFLDKAVRYKKNIIISGGTSTGKTTFTNAIIKCIPDNERLITIEDAREVKIPHENRVHLLASKGGQGVSKVTVKDLLEACLRLRPDRILLSELRGEEAFYFLRAVNSGHPGSITTLHADTPAGAFEQIVMMVKQAGVGLETEDIKQFLKSVIDVIVQWRRIDGKRVITGIWYEPKKQTI